MLSCKLDGGIIVLVSSLTGERAKARSGETGERLGTEGANGLHQHAKPVLLKDTARLRSVKPGALKSQLVPQTWKRKTGRCGSMIESFYHAFQGISLALKEQRNLRIHFLCAAVVVVLGFYFKVDAISWFALLLSIGFVISAELFNTALEHMVDLSAEGEYRLHARKAKDTAAAAVLVASIIAAAVGAIVFVPRILALFT